MLPFPYFVYGVLHRPEYRNFLGVRGPTEELWRPLLTGMVQAAPKWLALGTDFMTVSKVSGTSASAGCIGDLYAVADANASVDGDGSLGVGGWAKLTTPATASAQVAVLSGLSLNWAKYSDAQAMAIEARLKVSFGGTGKALLAFCDLPSSVAATSFLSSDNVPAVTTSQRKMVGLTVASTGALALALNNAGTNGAAEISTGATVSDIAKVGLVIDKAAKDYLLKVYLNGAFVYGLTATELAARTEKPVDNDAYGIVMCYKNPASSSSSGSIICDWLLSAIKL